MSRAEDRSADWRSQIKRKVNERTGRPPAGGESKGSNRVAHRDQHAEPPLFDYQLSEPARKTRKSKVVRFTKKGSALPQVAEKPLIRAPVSSPVAVRAQLPKQQALTLDAPLGPPVSFSPATEKEGDPAQTEVSREVIFSRLLAGMIDLVFPFLIAFVFTLSASYILNFEFISTSSARLGALFSLCFFFLNSFFFMILSGQTPGMYMTDLRLVGEDSGKVSFPSLVLRVFLFLPVAASVLGLLWCLGDPWCRCAHDRVSRTQIVPIPH